MERVIVDDEEFSLFWCTPGPRAFLLRQGAGFRLGLSPACPESVAGPE